MRRLTGTDFVGGWSEDALNQNSNMFYHVNLPKALRPLLVTIDLSDNSPPYDIPIRFCIPWRTMLSLDTLIDKSLKLSKFSLLIILCDMTLYGTDVCEDFAVPLSSNEPEDEGQWTPQK
jgi:hypothetical protein